MTSGDLATTIMVVAILIFFGYCLWLMRLGR